jgi:hypothetical protein
VFQLSEAGQVCVEVFAFERIVSGGRVGRRGVWSEFSEFGNFRHSEFQ